MNTNNENESVNTEQEQPKTYSGQDVEAIVRQRIAETNARHEQELQAMRAEYRQRLGTQADTVSNFVAKSQAQAQAEEVERVELRKLFGPGSSTADANRLALENKNLYQQLKRRAVELKVIPDPTPAAAIQMRGFLK